MGGQIELRCRCGEVRGMAANLSPRSVNRIVCYCDDCQAFAHQIGRADLLDPQGGSDIVQLAPAAVSFTQGQHRIVGLRLKPGGRSALRHWHTLQDEFIWVVEGEIVLVTDAGEQVLTPGTAAGFPAGKQDAHYLVNRTARDVLYLEVGDRTPGDLPNYPDDDFAAAYVDGQRVWTRKDGTRF